MPDLSDLMRDAASQAGSRPVDIEAVVRRGDRLRLQRTITRASSPVLVVLALLLVLPQTLGNNTVKFLPSDPPGAVASPPADFPDATEAPATKSERRRLRRNSDGTVVPVDGSGRHGIDSSGGLVAGSGDARTPSGGVPAPGRQPGDGGNDPADPPQDPGVPPPKPAPLPKEPGTNGPPQQEYCDANYMDAPRGGSTSCSYTATHAGGFAARNSYGYVYHPNPSTAPDYWRVEIQRGSEVVRYDNHNFPSSCMDDAIRPGDIVTATVFRPEGPDDPFNLDLHTGRYRGCSP